MTIGSSSFAPISFTSNPDITAHFPELLTPIVSILDPDITAYIIELLTPVILNGTPGNDILMGSWGDDILSGGDGSDEIWGDHGDDFIYGGQGSEFIRGGPGDDFVYGGDDIDSLYGDDGSDFLWGGYGADELNGGTGHDTFYYGDPIHESQATTGGSDIIYDFSYNGRNNGDYDKIDLPIAGTLDNFRWDSSNANRMEDAQLEANQTYGNQGLTYVYLANGNPSPSYNKGYLLADMDANGDFETGILLYTSHWGDFHYDAII